MTTPIVEVEGIEPTDVVDVSYTNAKGNQIGTAKITVANTGANRSLFVSGADVTITEGGSRVWSGEVIGKPSNADRSNLTVEIEAETKAAQAEYGKVNRPFIAMSRSDILREAVDFEVDERIRSRMISTASSTTDWSSSAPIFERTNDTIGINEYGSNTLFIGMPGGTSGTVTTTYDSIPSNATPGRRLLALETRFLVNNAGDLFDAFVELTDHDGIRYRWEVDLPTGAGWNMVELPFDDADVTTDAGDPRFTLRLEITGTLPDSRAAAIDMVRATPFSLRSRGSGIDVNAFDTDDEITRRVDKSILTLANELATEAGATVYVDTDDVIRFEQAGTRTFDKSIDYADDSIAVVDVDVNRDYDVKNQVVVQGKDDLQASFEDSASIQFYNVEAPRPEPINDPSLRTRDQLEARARGFLRENAWDDSAITFTLAGSDWREATVGEVIPVDWPPEDIVGDFEIDAVGRTTEGYTQIGLTGTVTT